MFAYYLLCIPQTRRSGNSLLPYDPKLLRTLRKNMEAQQEVEMLATLATT